MDQEMNYGSDYKYVPATTINSGRGEEVLPDIFYYTIQISNICLVGEQNTQDFVLVDAGMPDSADQIIAITAERFGTKSRPKAIILTHGHFDHVGALIELVRHWEVPVYAHKLEMPYLTGEKSYPEPDSTVEGGLMAKMAPFFPHEPINLGDYIHTLPEDGTVPHMPDFKWIHTPGHTPGHISLFREKDGTLIAGDAFVTVKQDSLTKVYLQTQEINGPPKYFTPDWIASRESVMKLEALKPEVAVTGHGIPMSGQQLAEGLEKLVKDFDNLAIPNHGKYVDRN